METQAKEIVEHRSPVPNGSPRRYNKFISFPPSHFFCCQIPYYTFIQLGCCRVVMERRAWDTHFESVRHNDGCGCTRHIPSANPDHLEPVVPINKVMFIDGTKILVSLAVSWGLTSKIRLWKIGVNSVYSKLIEAKILLPEIFLRYHLSLICWR